MRIFFLCTIFMIGLAYSPVFAQQTPEQAHQEAEKRALEKIEKFLKEQAEERARDKAKAEAAEKERAAQRAKYKLREAAEEKEREELDKARKLKEEKEAEEQEQREAEEREEEEQRQRKAEEEEEEQQQRQRWAEAKEREEAAAEEAEERLEEIKREAERAEAERKRKHEQMLKDNRMAVISNFESSEIPTSASMIKESKLYYFSYAYSQYDLTNEVPTIYVSSPFPVTKYADGTWPYEKDVLGEIRESTPYSPILHGNYPSLDAAQEAYNSFVRRLKNESVAVKTFDYEGKNAGSSTNSSTLDFWGNEKGEKKKVEKKTEAGAELDFWGNKVPNKKVAPKKTNKKTN